LLQGVFKFRWNEETQYIAKIFLSMIPVLIIGLFFKELVEQIFGSGLLIVGCCLLVTAGLLSFAYFGKNTRQKEKMGWRDAFLIGIAQAIAILPGLSRSGATISTGILLGNKRENVAKFSFLMVLIPILGEALLDMKGFLSAGNEAVLSPIVLLAGFLAAFITGCIACKLMISLVKKGKLIYFAIYCAVIGAVAIGYSLF
jgi:undecaprenyl-diphosphatase